jgi:hypothetical protein
MEIVGKDLLLSGSISGPFHVKIDINLVLSRKPEDRYSLLNS